MDSSFKEKASNEISMEKRNDYIMIFNKPLINFPLNVAFNIQVGRY